MSASGVDITGTMYISKIGSPTAAQPDHQTRSGYKMDPPKRKFHSVKSFMIHSAVSPSEAEQGVGAFSWMSPVNGKM